jgi:hypothetical protein
MQRQTSKATLLQKPNHSFIFRLLLSQLWPYRIIWAHRWNVQSISAIYLAYIKRRVCTLFCIGVFVYTSWRWLNRRIDKYPAVIWFAVMTSSVWQLYFSVCWEARSIWFTFFESDLYLKIISFTRGIRGLVFCSTGWSKSLFAPDDYNTRSYM